MNLSDEVLGKRKGIVHLMSDTLNTPEGRRLMLGIQSIMLIYELRYLAHLDVIEYIGRSPLFDEMSYVAGKPLPLYIAHIDHENGFGFTRVTECYTPREQTVLGYSNRLKNHIIVSDN